MDFELKLSQVVICTLSNKKSSCSIRDRIHMDLGNTLDLNSYLLAKIIDYKAVNSRTE